jgi:AraC-like DNA-binding protein
MILLQSTADKVQAMAAQDAFFQYLPVDEKTTSCGMYVTGAGRAVIRPGDKYPPYGQPTLYHCDWLRGRTLPEYQLIFITEGAGEFESHATGHVEINGPTLIFLFPGVWHRLRPAADVGWTERWISFNGELVPKLFAIGSFDPSLAVTRPHDPNRLAMDYDCVLDALRGHLNREPAVLTFHLLRTFADAVAQRLDDSMKSSKPENLKAPVKLSDPIVEKALEIIWSHSQHPLSVGDIARQLPVTRRTLDRRFVEATGHSVLEEINACRFSRAKRLLEETDEPVKTVAHLAGFSSTERMRVLFVEREGKSPSEYRKSFWQTRNSADVGVVRFRQSP